MQYSSNIITTVRKPSALLRIQLSGGKDPEMKRQLDVAPAQGSVGGMSN